MFLTAPIWTDVGLLINRATFDTTKPMLTRAHWHKKMGDAAMLWYSMASSLLSRTLPSGSTVSSLPMSGVRTGLQSAMPHLSSNDST